MYPFDLDIGRKDESHQRVNLHMEGSRHMGCIEMRDRIIVKSPCIFQYYMLGLAMFRPVR